MKHYKYKGFAVFISPSAVAKYGDPQWRADRSTPLGWGYRIDMMPGKVGISRGEDYATQEDAETAAEERIGSWN